MSSHLFRTSDYKRQVKKIGKEIQKILIKQERYLEKDMFHPSLHTKKLKGLEPDKVFSFRITRTYRAIFRLNQDGMIVLFAIGHRKDIYKDN